MNLFIDEGNFVREIIQLWRVTFFEQQNLKSEFKKIASTPGLCIPID